MTDNLITCPSCGTAFPVPEGLNQCFCPNCGRKILCSAPEERKTPQAEYRTGVFTDSAAGITAGSAMVPDGYTLTAKYETHKIDEITPFGTTATAVSPDGRMTVGSRYGEHWYHYLINGPLQLASNRKQWKKYMEPEDYLRNVAERIAGTAVTPASGGPIQTRYSVNRSEEAAKLVSRFEENAHISLPNIQCDLRLQNILCESRALLCHYTRNGTAWTILAGADLFGLEYYDASPMGSLNRGMTSVIRLQGRKKKDTGADAPFGHAKDAGKPVDAIEWGAKRLYFAVGPKENEAEVIKNFMTYTATWAQDPALDRQLEQIHANVRVQEQASLQKAMNYAAQSQALNAQRQAQISQTLNQTSDIVMQGYNNRMASQDRISQNWSEAIRGVDSYVTGDGRTVEHSVVSDHVYQNQYGDTIGVSGSLDEIPKDWTEIYKKDGG